LGRRQIGPVELDRNQQINRRIAVQWQVGAVELD
jgi:hypothetical protein